MLALGKLGGVELNYSSDIDLLFLARQAATEYERLGRELIKILTQATGEGFLYRVDMRLRPWGRAGPSVPTLAGYRSYLEQHARLWEKQALLKARVIAGNQALGTEALALPHGIASTDGKTLPAAGLEAARAGIYAMKQMTEAQLRRQGREWGEVKLGKGSIRDVEFVAQYLQLAHGPEHPRLWGGNTLNALTAWPRSVSSLRTNSACWPKVTFFCARWSTTCNCLSIARPTLCLCARRSLLIWRSGSASMAPTPRPASSSATRHTARQCVRFSNGI